MHLSLPKRFPLFVLTTVCWSLQCLTSALTQGGGGGHFFRLTCSVPLWGGRNAANKHHGVCGECSQCLSRTGFAPARGVCAFMVYAAQALGCSAGNCLRQALGCVHFPGLSRSGSGSQVVLKGADSVGPAFCDLPRSEQLRRPGAWRAQSPPGGGCVLSPSLLLGFLGKTHAPSQVCRVSSGELISGRDPPGGCRPPRIPRSPG